MALPLQCLHTEFAFGEVAVHMAAVPNEAELACCVDGNPQGEHATQVAAGANDHGAKGYSLVNLFGNEIGVHAGRRMVAEPTPGRRPGGRVPLKAKSLSL